MASSSATRTNAPATSLASPALSSAASPPERTLGGDPKTYALAIAEVQDYLDMWRDQGAATAAARYLSPGQLSTGDPQGYPELKSGRVKAYQPYQWISADRFTLLVTLEVELADAQASSGGGGDYFITFSRPNTQTPYRMVLATSP